MRNIADLHINEKAIVVHIEHNESVAKYIALGIVPGASVQLLRKSPLNDAYYLKLGNHYLGIREDEAKLIRIEYPLQQN